MAYGSIVKTKTGIKRDPQKELTFSVLCDLLGQAGYGVRREALKQGIGWKTLSGACRARANRLIFVDRRMPQDEQIAFLASKLAAIKPEGMDPRKLEALPPGLRAALL